MSRKLKIYIGFLALFLIAIIIIDSNKPKPISWVETYDTTDKIPYGLYVFNQESPVLLKNRKVEKILSSPYEFLDSQYNSDSLVNAYQIEGTFMEISDKKLMDKESLDEIFYFASHGNTIFMSMKNFPKQLLDSLKLELNSDFQYKDKGENWVINPNLGTKKYHIEEGLGNNYFSKIDTLNTTVLGYQSGEKNRVNFIKTPYKNGNFILHTQPAVFTNFHLLKDDHSEYAAKVLSYIPEGNVFWSVKGQNGEIISNSKLRFIFNNPPLRSAWYLFLGGMLVFMIFNAKRRQRIVPTHKILTNTTIDFAKTIGNLYFQEGDHGNLINKKIIFFLEKIRQDYLLDTTVLDQQFIKKLQHKSGKDYRDVERVVYLINQHRKNNFTSIENDLIDINEAIEKILN